MANNLFSGLESLGLSGMTNMEIFEKEEQKESVQEKKEEHKYIETDYLYDKTCICPVCDREFKTKTIRTGKARLLSTDSDLRPRYQGIDPVKYDVIVCNNCGYAALVRFFEHITLSQAHLIKDNITPKFKGINDGIDMYTYDDAILRYRLALVNAVVKKSRISERAYICLKIAWLMRGKAEHLEENTPDYKNVIKELKANEQEFLEKAYEGFKGALGQEIFPICGMDEPTLIYLIADLARQCKDYDLAYKYTGEVIVSRVAGNKLKDRARELKEMIRKEVQE